VDSFIVKDPPLLPQTSAKKLETCAQNENLHWHDWCQKEQKIKQLSLVFPPKFDFYRV
jgi:hypothetical protein